MSSAGLKTTAPKIIEGIQQRDLVFIEDPHGYKWKGRQVPYTTGIIKDSGLGTDFGNCAPDHLAYRAKVGTALHLAARYLVTGTLDPTWHDPVVAPHLDALRLFWHESKAEPLAAEVALYSEMHGFATTVDSLWLWNGKRTLIEYKTSDSVYPSEEYQLWAQEIAWNEHFPDEAVESRYSLHLKKNGSYKTVCWDNASAYNFKHLMWIFQERQRRGLPCHI